ncbi:hypothetical protein F7D73_04000 [Prevotella copri]|jgi:hypothetical protein|uniref:Uncharacterized protein n=1 Tax=Segatella copri TaxID=165179 RepID=A0A6G1TYY2_9BACT|nr:hypothetical protein [Segatella copri]MQN80129.1 hypothetical protein [Segatella copri]
MKKDQNINSMNGTATMPSYFPCIKSSESHPLADFLKPTYMLQLDFDHVKKEDMVIEKEPIELNSDAAVDPTDTFED